MSRSASAKKHLDDSIRFAAAFPCDLVVGIDPDLHTPGIAAARWVGGEWVICWLDCPSTPKAFKGLSGMALLTDLVAESAAALRLKLNDSFSPKPTYPLIVVEAMKVRQAAGAETKNPQSLVDLSVAGGITAGIFHRELGASNGGRLSGEQIHVEPAVWKGSVKKPIHQARSYSKLGWDYKQLKDYSRPVNNPPVGSHLKRTDWKHVGDAVGLVLWACARIERQKSWNKHRRG